MIVLFIVGEPYVGKTTFCKRLVEWFGFRHLSLGDVLRRNTQHQKQIHKFTSQGVLIPNSLVIAILRTELHNYDGVVLLDGFPRSMENVTSWGMELEQAEPAAILHLVCAKTTIEERLQQRASRGARNDDSHEVLRKRLQSFSHDTIPVLKHYSGSIWELNTDGDIDDVCHRGFRLIQGIFIKKGLHFHDGSVLKWRALSDFCTPPRKGTPFSIGYDLFAAETLEVESWGRVTIKTDIAIQLPPGTYGHIVGRSGLSSRGLLVSPGVIDFSYSKNIKIILQNMNNSPFCVQIGMRVAQIIIEKVAYCKIVKQHTILETTRGSFGSTGEW